VVSTAKDSNGRCSAARRWALARVLLTLGVACSKVLGAGSGAADAGRWLGRAARRADGEATAERRAATREVECCCAEGRLVRCCTVVRMRPDGAVRWGARCRAAWCGSVRCVWAEQQGVRRCGLGGCGAGAMGWLSGAGALAMARCGDGSVGRRPGRRDGDVGGSGLVRAAAWGESEGEG